MRNNLRNHKHRTQQGLPRRPFTPTTKVRIQHLPIEIGNNIVFIVISSQHFKISTDIIFQIFLQNQFSKTIL